MQARFVRSRSFVAAIALATLAPRMGMAQEPTPSLPSSAAGMTVVAPLEGGGTMTAVGCSAVVVEGHAATVVKEGSPAPTPCAESVLVHFRAASDTDWWTLRRDSGEFVCKLPCSAWVPPHSGLVVVEEDAATYLPDHRFGVDRPGQRFALPDNLPVENGGELSIVVDGHHAGGALGKLLGGALMVSCGLSGGILAGFGTAYAVDPEGMRRHDREVAARNGAPPPGPGASSPAAPMLVGGGVFLALAVLSGYWMVKAREPSMKMSPSDPKPQAKRTNEVRFAVGPAGVGATF